MRRALKVTGVILVLLFGLAIWRNFFFYPKIWTARITVGGRGCGACAIYVHSSRLGGVLVLRERQTWTLYSLAFPNLNFDVPNGKVWKCDEAAFSFGPGFAYDNLNQRCASVGFAPAQRQIRMDSRLIEFTDDDGKRVKVVW